jgi:DNA-binding NarL/FixJ family response regulator
VSTRVLVADDEALLRTAFSSLIDAEDDLEVVGEAADGSEAVTQAIRLSPDVVVMDVRMPVMDGIEATRQITSSGTAKPTRVLILTTFDLDEYVFEALRAGASGFALKSRPLEELLRLFGSSRPAKRCSRRVSRGGSSPASRSGPRQRARHASSTRLLNASARSSRWSRKGFRTRSWPRRST